jgi:hypothetical protein
MRTIELPHILLVLTVLSSVAHAKSAWDQTATSADERIRPALLPRTDTGPLPAPPSARVGMTIGMSRLAQRAREQCAQCCRSRGCVRTALPRAIDAALMGQAAALSLGRLRRVESLQTMILLIYSTAEKSNSCWRVAPGSTRSVTMWLTNPCHDFITLSCWATSPHWISGGWFEPSSGPRNNFCL